MFMITKNKKILIIIGGGISAYKSLDLIRLLRKDSYEIKIVLTKGGKQFVTPLSLISLSGGKVYENLFDKENEADIDHISLSRWADLIVVVPATANLISKLNDALGLTSVLVTHDLEVSLNIVDYCIFFASGSVVGHGTPDEIRQSDNPLIKQFINGEIDGPVPLHYPASDYRSDLGLGG